MTFRERLRKTRKKKGLSQRQVAEMIGITQAGYAAYETDNPNGYHQPSLDTLVRIAQVLGVPTDYLLGMPDVDGTIKEKLPGQRCDDIMDNLKEVLRDGSIPSAHKRKHMRDILRLFIEWDESNT